jgi:hypothetical protein
VLWLDGISVLAIKHASFHLFSIYLIDKTGFWCVYLQKNRNSIKKDFEPPPTPHLQPHQL